MIVHASPFKLTAVNLHANSHYLASGYASERFFFEHCPAQLPKLSNGDINFQQVLLDMIDQGQGTHMPLSTMLLTAFNIKADAHLADSSFEIFKFLDAYLKRPRHCKDSGSKPLRQKARPT